MKSTPGGIVFIYIIKSEAFVTSNVLQIVERPKEDNYEAGNAPVVIDASNCFS